MTKIPIAKCKASKTSKSISHLVELFPASHSEKNFNLDRPSLFTVFAAECHSNAKAGFKQHIFVWGHASTAKQELQRVLMQKSVPSPFICTAEKLYYLTLKFLARHGRICI